MAINQVLPPDWELTRAGDKRKASVYNAQRAIMEVGKRLSLQMGAMLSQWETKTFINAIKEECGYIPTDTALAIAQSRIRQGMPLVRSKRKPDPIPPF